MLGAGRVSSELAPLEAKSEVAGQGGARPWLKRYWQWSLAALLALVFIGFYFVRRPQSPSSHSPKAVLADSRASASQVRLTGKTQAVLSRAILAPVLSGQQVSTLTVIKLIPSGSRVKKGDVLAEFDRQAQLRDIVDKQAQADDQNGKVLQAEAAELAAKAKDQTELEQAESALSKAELEMKKFELLSRIDAEKAQQTLDEAKAPA